MHKPLKSEQEGKRSLRCLFPLYSLWKVRVYLKPSEMKKEILMAACLLAVPVCLQALYARNVP